MPGMRRAVLPWRFYEVLEAAGIIANKERVSELRIIARPREVVTIEVTYIADSRLLDLGRPGQGEEEGDGRAE